MDNKIFSQETIALLETLGVNQAGACQIVLQLHKERLEKGIIESPQYETFYTWCKYKFEEAPYDEFE